MARRRKLIAAKMAVIAGAIPFLIWAYEFGPGPGYTKAPGDQGTCTVAGCHIGGTNDPSNKGSISVTFPNGPTYVAGARQHLVVTLTDPATTQKAWGFQLTARVGTTSTMAGTFASTDANTTLICSTANLVGIQEAPFVAGKTQTCPAALPLEYIEHSLAGYNAGRGHTGGQSWEFDWTPPAAATGNITIYVTGNAASGDLTTFGDHIYNTNYTLTTCSGTAVTNILSASAFGGFKTVAPGSWMEVYGCGLANTTRQWGGGDFNGVKAPTALDNVKVTVGGQPAFVYYISPTQINAQVPSNAGTDAQAVVVSNGGTPAAPRAVTVNALQPGLLAPDSFQVNGKQYVVAQFGDGSYVLPPGAITGLTTRQAKPGETIVIYGVGFGPVQDASGNDIPAGVVVTGLNHLARPFAMSIGGSPATLSYQGLATQFVGLYQFNVTVPNIPDNDFAPLTYALNGAAGTQTLFLAVHN